jgi:hypothetical protein
MMSRIDSGNVSAILKMKFFDAGINSGHHNLPTYEISLKSNYVEFALMLITSKWIMIET